MFSIQCRAFCDFFNYDFAFDVAGKAFYPGSQSATTYNISMSDDHDTQVISGVGAGTAGEQRLESTQVRRPAFRPFYSSSKYETKQRNYCRRSAIIQQPLSPDLGTAVTTSQLEQES